MQKRAEPLSANLGDRRRKRKVSVKGTSKLPPSVERRSGAAVRSTDFVSRHRNVSVFP
jgi:hypothetical protein